MTKNQKKIEAKRKAGLKKAQQHAKNVKASRQVGGTGSNTLNKVIAARNRFAKPTTLEDNNIGSGLAGPTSTLPGTPVNQQTRDNRLQLQQDNVNTQGMDAQQKQNYYAQQRDVNRIDARQGGIPTQRLGNVQSQLGGSQQQAQQQPQQQAPQTQPVVNNAPVVNPQDAVNIAKYGAPSQIPQAVDQNGVVAQQGLQQQTAIGATPTANAIKIKQEFATKLESQLGSLKAEYDKIGENKDFITADGMQAKEARALIVAQARNLQASYINEDSKAFDASINDFDSQAIEAKQPEEPRLNDLPILQQNEIIDSTMKSLPGYTRQNIIDYLNSRADGTPFEEPVDPQVAKDEVIWNRQQEADKMKGAQELVKNTAGYANAVTLKQALEQMPLTDREKQAQQQTQSLQQGSPIVNGQVTPEVESEFFKLYSLTRDKKVEGTETIASQEARGTDSITPQEDKGTNWEALEKSDVGEPAKVLPKKKTEQDVIKENDALKKKLSRAKNKKETLAIRQQYASELEANRLKIVARIPRLKKKLAKLDKTITKREGNQTPYNTATVPRLKKQRKELVETLEEYKSYDTDESKEPKKKTIDSQLKKWMKENKQIA